MSKGKISIGADHRGVPLKKILSDELKKSGYEVLDFGAQSEDSVDYPDFAIKAAEAVAKGQADRGIVICNSGIGMSISANKVKGIRAALCHDLESAKASRQHNNANVLALGAAVVSADLAKKITAVWLDTPFEGGRHEKRVGKISTYEQKH